MEDLDIIGYSGAPGASANIDLSVPLPGAHSGRRIIEITDVPDDAWSEIARESGTDWATELGFELLDDKFELQNADVYVDRYFNHMQQATHFTQLLGKQPTLANHDVHQLVSAVQVATKQDADDTLSERGHLRDWRGGVDVKGMALPAASQISATARVATAPDQAVASAKSASTGAAEAISYAFQSSLNQIDAGVVSIPAVQWGGSYTTVDVDLNEVPEPRLFIIQVFGISSTLGDYGLGRTVKTLTLAGGEEYHYSTRTWRATTESRSLASSIVDSFDESSSERFADTVMAETTDTATQEKSSNWHVEAEAKGSIGIASGSVSGGGGGQKASSTEEFARAVDESVSEHSNEASSHRENSVTSSSETSEETEAETTVERSIKNINVSRTLNYVLRELNSVFQTKTHLKDIRIGFSNGRAGSWRETPLSGMASFIDELIDDPDTGKEVLAWILDYVAVAFDKDDTPQTVLERVQMDKCGQKIESITDAQQTDDCKWPLPPRDLSFFLPLQTRGSHSTLRHRPRRRGVSGRRCAAARAGNHASHRQHRV